MRHEVACEIVDICHGAGVDAELFEGYSGRFMYGEKTTGVVVSSTSDMMYALAGAGGIVVESTFRTDSLGLNTIVY